VIWPLATLRTLAGADAVSRPAPLAISVVDGQTGRGVPLLELRTVHGASYITDSDGIAAISQPTRLGRDVCFDVSSQGSRQGDLLRRDFLELVLRQLGCGATI
jgi:hypothetical protein